VSYGKCYSVVLVLVRGIVLVLVLVIVHSESDSGCHSVILVSVSCIL
jgi:hypothetical protein